MLKEACFHCITLENINFIDRNILVWNIANVLYESELIRFFGIMKIKDTFTLNILTTSYIKTKFTRDIMLVFICLAVPNTLPDPNFFKQVLDKNWHHKLFTVSSFTHNKIKVLQQERVFLPVYQWVWFLAR